MERLTNTISRNWCVTLLTIFVAAFVIRVGFTLTLQDGFYFPDSVIYSEAAVNLLTNGEFGEGYGRPPGYPVFLVAIYAVIGESVLAIRIVESLMGALLAVLIVVLGWRVGGSIVGVIAGILWSIYPIAVFIAGLVYPTGLMATLLAGGVLFLLPYSHEDLSPRRVFLAGVLCGLAALTIPIVLATIAVISLWILYWSPTKRWSIAFLLILGAALTTVPWTMRNYYLYDRIVPLQVGVTGQLPPIGSDRQNRRDDKRDDKIDAIVSQPGLFAAHVFKEFLNFWKIYPDRIAMANPKFRERMHEMDHRVVKNTILTANDLMKAVSALSTGPLFLFAIIGTALMGFDPQRRRALSLFCGIILSVAVGYSFFYGKMRYRIPVEPYIIILAAYGITTTWSVLATRLAYGTRAHSRRLETQKEA